MSETFDVPRIYVKKLPEDLTGKVFNNYTVLYKLPKIKRKNVKWMCLCKCGSQKEVTAGNLHHANIKSCGCDKTYDDLTGRRFTRLLVISRVIRPRDKRYIWLCKCDCGKEITISASALKAKKTPTRSCGCFKTDVLVASNKKQVIHGKAATPEYRMLHRCKWMAKKAEVPFDLTLEDIKIPKYCPVLGILLKSGKGKIIDSSPSMDRLIPSKGYIKENCRVISMKANIAKSNSSRKTIKDLAKYLDKNLSPKYIKRLRYPFFNPVGN